MNERHRTDEMPDRTSEWLLYQTLVGAHPLPLDRAWQAMEKSIREAKARTSWVRPNAAFEDATRRFVQACWPTLRSSTTSATSGGPRRAGRVNWLPLETMKLLAPGTPTSTKAPSCGTAASSTPTTACRRLRRRRQPTTWRPRPARRCGRDRDQADAWLPKLFVLRSALALRRLRRCLWRRVDLRAARARGRRRGARHRVRPGRRGRRRRPPGRAGARRAAAFRTGDAARRRVWQHVLTGDQVEAVRSPSTSCSSRSRSPSSSGSCRRLRLRSRRGCARGQSLRRSPFARRSDRLRRPIDRSWGRRQSTRLNSSPKVPFRLETSRRRRCRRRGRGRAGAAGGCSAADARRASG